MRELMFSPFAGPVPAGDATLSINAATARVAALVVGRICGFVASGPLIMSSSEIGVEALWCRVASYGGLSGSNRRLRIRTSSAQIWSSLEATKPHWARGALLPKDLVRYTTLSLCSYI